MFRIDMLPAGHGDCLWIEYGEKDAPSRVLIDGGTAQSYPALRRRIEALAPAQRRVELFVITHIDTDHIGGSLELLRDMDELKVRFRDVWFNGWQQIIPSGLGARDGERLSDHLREGVKARRLAWNKPFGGKAAVVPDAGKLPAVKLPGGMKLTVLAPTRAQLTKLRAEWLKVITGARLKPGQVEDEKRPPARRDILGPPPRFDVDDLADSKFTSDSKAANGSSIALLAEYGCKSCLLTGDAYATTLADSLRRLISERGLAGGRFPLDALKVSHHGSRKNLSTRLLEAVKCRRYLFSTNGDHHSHPNLESAARVIRYGGNRPQLLFNYRTRFNEMWDNCELMDEFDYRVKYGSTKEPGFLRLNL